MDIRLLRIDSRLLHGQVTTNWVRALHVDRILIVSDEVSRDQIRKSLILQAVPPGQKVHVITVEKLLRLYNDERFADMKVLIIVETPQVVAEIVRGGIPITTVNIGSLSFQEGKKMVTDTIAVDEWDVAHFQWLHDQGIDLEVRKVSHDKPKDLWCILCDKQFV